MGLLALFVLSGKSYVLFHIYAAPLRKNSYVTDHSGIKIRTFTTFTLHKF
jgi:hypothetical protein